MRLVHNIINWFSFKNPNINLSNDILLSGLTVESNQFRTGYSNWLTSNNAQNLLEWLRSEVDKKSNLANYNGDEIHFLNCQGMSGFVLDFNSKKWKKEDFIFLFNYLKTQLLKTDYYNNHFSEHKNSEMKGKKMCMLRHLLKPNPPNPNLCHKFGNIMICLYVESNQPRHIKFSSLWNGESTFDFTELMRLVLR